MLNDLDPHNLSMGFRIALSSAGVFGKGYGSEATKAVVDYGLEVMSGSTASAAWRSSATLSGCTRAGFHPEGILRDAWYWDGEWSDVIVMAKLAAG